MGKLHLKFQEDWGKPTRSNSVINCGHGRFWDGQTLRGVESAFSCLGLWLLRADRARLGVCDCKNLR
eukprot:5587939-Pyramimonas_sp.AAC.1